MAHSRHGQPGSGRLESAEASGCEGVFAGRVGAGGRNRPDLCQPSGAGARKSNRRYAGPAGSGAFRQADGVLST